MTWYVTLSVYISTMLISFIALSNLEWGKLTRTSRHEFVWMAYIVISLVVGSDLGSFILKIVEVFLNI